MVTDVDREIERFEDFLDQEDLNLSDLNLQELDDELSDWMDSLDIPIEFHETMKRHLMQGIVGEAELGEEAEAEIEEEAEQVVEEVVKRTGKKWTEQEISRLKNLYMQGRAVPYIQRLLGRSRSSIYHKTSRAGIRRPVPVRERRKQVNDMV